MKVSAASCHPPESGCLALVLGTNELTSAIVTASPKRRAGLRKDAFLLVIRRCMTFTDLLSSEFEGVIRRRTDTVAEIVQIHAQQTKLR